ncbi:MAG: ABC transporter permease [Thermogemmatispora sp.]|uniref:ABC transporter permease n=1 Tax=Thermogemmatispora sp. TaxID=1968838 RepID=UPI002619B268|nr:ABC transporter permease [Thermogemmatispora sp.]MBX5456532.1 ABC transporter permease [Thermogemmatispora sp.]
MAMMRVVTGARFGLGRLRRWWLSLVLPLVAIGLALLLGAVVMLISGFSPLDAYSGLFQGAFGTLPQFAETLNEATPLLLIGLGIAVAFRAGAFNIGGVGQEYLGALAAVVVGGKFTGLPGGLHLALATVAGFVAGGLWAAPAAWLKVRFGINEVITSILLNYIAIYFIDYMISGPIHAPGFTAAPTSFPVQQDATFPILVRGSDLNAGFLLALLALVVIFVLLRYTTWGYRMRLVGLNREAARHAGVHVDRVYLLSFFISGALAGLAGAIEILGYRYQLITGFAPNTGYDAIAVALLGGLNPGGVGLAALFFGALANGASAMEAIAQLPSQLADIVRTLAILAVLAVSSPVILDLVRQRQSGGQTAGGSDPSAKATGADGQPPTSSLEPETFVAE